MKKKEIIWREILYQAIEKNNRAFTQKDIAANFGFSLSTVFNALKAPREIKAIKVTGRNFTVFDEEKLLYLWATHRKISKDIIYETYAEGNVLKIESEMPPDVVYAAYSAYRKKFGEPPADYDNVYVYSSDINKIKKRFPQKKGGSNLIVLQADPFLKGYGLTTTISHTFVDIWNLPEWYSKDFIGALKGKIAHEQ